GSHTAMTREDGKLVEVVIKDPQSVVAKDKIHKIWFDKDSICLFTDAYNAFIVKKRYLKDGEFDELKAFIKEHYMLKREK
ncbi:MAG: YcxB family protein, partial [Campylobacteraceae bacterium]|nr:YcxB family protein [Campylobacteraceae bacterium]